MTMRFRTLADTLEALEPLTSRLQMLAVLADLLRQADPEEVGELVYLTQGRLLPDFIQEEFGMNERLVVRSIALAYKLNPDDVLARFKQLGDAGLTAQEFAQNRSAEQVSKFSETEGLPLKEVYSRLMEITKAVGSEARNARYRCWPRSLSNSTR